MGIHPAIIPLAYFFQTIRKVVRIPTAMHPHEFIHPLTNRVGCAKQLFALMCVASGAYPLIGQTRGIPQRIVIQRNALHRELIHPVARPRYGQKAIFMPLVIPQPPVGFGEGEDAGLQPGRVRVLFMMRVVRQEIPEIAIDRGRIFLIHMLLGRVDVDGNHAER